MGGFGGGLFDSPRAAQRGRSMNGVWRGKVVRVVGTAAYVEIPRLARGRELGPVEVLEGPWTAGLRTEEESGGGGEASFAAHTHGAGVDLAPGDRVLVAFIEGSVDQPVVLGRLA